MKDMALRKKGLLTGVEPEPIAISVSDRTTMSTKRVLRQFAYGLGIFEERILDGVILITNF